VEYISDFARIAVDNPDISSSCQSAMEGIIFANNAKNRLRPQHLCMCFCDIETKQIAKELADNTSATVLLLHGNYIDSPEAKDIATVLLKNRTFVALGLESKINTDGTEYG
jgi:hypothetical protein